ncbi:HSF-type DNA-binding-domain-containing protein [Gilbertella persicaria]|uniref:HSF-type DNA-binding-domain-containing protein n=1 Tax=Gilbertella persicaria TaxID=101096 RepID=UPI002220CA29|nr:HSF-type DNA-binding-domain-containing protein [Gilbertella persicaria]KAI8079011.1 HSF-type DNA-binding-domain-containing protein [Gilbertella persicaria]
MSTIDTFSIQMPQPTDWSDNYFSFDRSKRSSTSSLYSNGSAVSLYEVPSLQEERSTRHSNKKGVSSFITKLFSMVEECYHQHLISWNPSGTSFFVCHAIQFSRIVLPEYFKHSNFSSFVRLLNMYGFHKINKSPRGQRNNNDNEIWEFSHPKFQHGRPDLLKDIKRKAMDSELLRRETGDIHASFAALQMTQTDLLQQFQTLQDNFSHLLKCFEQSKKIQTQQQMAICQLAEIQGLDPHNLFSSDSLALFPTIQPTPDATLTMYNTSNHSSPSSLSPSMLDITKSQLLPNSPVPSNMSRSNILVDNDPLSSRYEDTFALTFST